jgi:thiamine-phosphate pyrophosphorylase
VIICLVTDRRRADPVVQAAHAAGAGIDLVQVREPDLVASALAALAGRVLDAVRGSRTRVVVNDRLDVAWTSGAHGVHLRADSIPPAAVRTIAPHGFIVGRSVHAVEDAVAAAGAVDYVLAGTVFATASKPGRDRLLGAEGLRAIVERVPVPVLAIGGVTADRIDAIAATGAAGIAAIGLFADPGRLASVVALLHSRFDSVRSPP